jgi:hypothetical protein
MDPTLNKILETNLLTVQYLQQQIQDQQKIIDSLKSENKSLTKQIKKGYVLVATLGFKLASRVGGYEGKKKFLESLFKK